MLKLDMNKAYDQVEWPFLLFMLHSFGFQELAVELIFRTLANNWLSVLINGKSTTSFKYNRGVQQGNLLSLTLFLLVVEFLGRGIFHLFLDNEHWFLSLLEAEFLILPLQMIY